MSDIGKVLIALGIILVVVVLQSFETEQEATTITPATISEESIFDVYSDTVDTQQETIDQSNRTLDECMQTLDQCINALRLTRED